ncbi:MAG: hypothetical protein VYE22_27505 [Myxococcota bacterium]|nr:hypothetical protein [Myxococcota bacterium]
MTRAVLALAMTPVMSSCVLLSPPNYDDPPDLPSQVFGRGESQMSDIGRIDLDLAGGGGGDAGEGNEVRLEALVVDLNVTQPLVGQVFLNYRRDSDQNLPLVEDLPIPVSGERERFVSFSIPRTEPRLEAGQCFSVELHVAARFEGRRNPRPPEGVPLAVGRWFIEVVNSETLSAPAGTCGEGRFGDP